MTKNRDQLIQLHKILIERFNTSELQAFCFYLGITYDNLSGTSLSDKVLDLIGHLERRDQIGEIVRVGQELRPDISWGTLFPGFVTSQALPEVAFVSDFDNQKALWDTGIYEHEGATLEKNIVAGIYLWQIRSDTSWVLRQESPAPLLANYELTTAVKHQHSTHTVSYGLFFGRNAYGYFVYTIDNNQFFYLKYRDYDKDAWIWLGGYTRSPAIKKDDVNILQVIVIEQRIHLLVNDQTLAIFTDDRSKTGQAGMVINTYDEEDTEATIEFSHFSLKHIS